MKTLSIVVPVYFNEGSLPDLFNKLLYIEDLLSNKTCYLN